MTLDKILAGLHELALRLGNNHDSTPPPDGWAPEEWAYVKGLASARIWLLIADLRQAP
jgi:hypothetical protein